MKSRKILVSFSVFMLAAPTLPRGPNAREHRLAALGGRPGGSAVPEEACSLPSHR